MRLRLRLRTMLLAVGLLSPPLACVAIVARHGGLSAFRDYHARVAYYHWVSADDYRERAEQLQKQRGSAERIEDFRRREREHLREARWHAFLSGRLIEMTTL